METTLPVLVVDKKGHVMVKQANDTLRHYVGIAFDAILNQFVLIDMVLGFIEYLVSPDFEAAQLEMDYLRGKLL